MCLIGDPGTAKTYMVTRLVKRIDSVNFFKILMSAFTKDTQLTGPVDMAAYKQSIYRFITAGYLPRANIALLDEGFKGSSVALNLLLGIVLEREFKNGDVMDDVPLCTLFVTSNEGPQGSELNAFYDRLTFRFNTQPLQDRSNMEKLLTLKVDPNPKPIITWDDIVAAQAEVAAITVPTSTVKAIVDLKIALANKGIMITDRKFQQIVRVAQGQAWLDGAGTVQKSHLSVCEHMLWDQPEQKDDVAKIVLRAANPMERDVNKLIVGIKAINKEIVKAAGLPFQSVEQQTLADEIYKSIERAAETYRDLKAKVGTARRITEQMEWCKREIEALSTRVVVEVYRLNPGAIEPPSL